MTVGDEQVWSDIFPDDLIPRIIDLVWDTWQAVPSPAINDLEVPITRRFKHSLKQAKDYRKLPVRIEREAVEDDPKTGAELGRIDLKLVPAGSALEEVYFAFECKRLNAVERGRPRTLAPKYVTQGMMRFVDGRYGGSVIQGGMIGYVLDGRTSHAISRVGKNIDSRRTLLRLTAGPSLQPSTVRPANTFVRETMHVLPDSRVFRLHHIFLAGAGHSSVQASERRPKEEKRELGQG